MSAPESDPSQPQAEGPVACSLALPPAALCGMALADLLFANTVCCVVAGVSSAANCLLVCAGVRDAELYMLIIQDCMSVLFVIVGLLEADLV